VNYKMSYMLLWAGLIAGVILFFLGFWMDNRGVFWGGILVAVLGVIQTRAFYRCPACGGRFKSHGPLVKVCPHCGEELE